MAQRVTAKISAEVLVSPCFNCGQENNFVYDPANDSVPAGRGHIQCLKCGVIGPGDPSLLIAVVGWNRLYKLTQEAKAYNALAGSPMEFAAMLRSIKEDAEMILQAKESIEQRRRIDESRQHMNDVLVKATKAFTGFYTISFGDAYGQLAKEYGPPGGVAGYNGVKVVGRRYKQIKQDFNAAIKK